MAGRKSALVTWERRQEVARLYIQGHSQADIASRMGVNQATISRDLVAIEEEWRERSSSELQRHKTVQLARIDEMERVYWDAWISSKGTVRTKTVKEAKPNQTTEDGGPKLGIKQVVRTKELIGNPDFLKGVEWCIAERSKLLGLYQIAGTEDRPLVVKMVGAGMADEV